MNPMVLILHLKDWMHVPKGDAMRLPKDPEIVQRVEGMLLKEMDGNGHVMVRSLDKIHARTGLKYTLISEIARRLQERTSRAAGA
jgi:hypothetical protein